MNACTSTQPASSASVRHLYVMSRAQVTLLTVMSLSPLLWRAATATSSDDYAHVCSLSVYLSSRLYSLWSLALLVALQDCLRPFVRRPHCHCRQGSVRQHARREWFASQAVRAATTCAPLQSTTS